jgi:hypothetical protein
VNKDHSIIAKIFEEVNCSLKGKAEKLDPSGMQLLIVFVTKGHKHTKPPKNCNHKYSLFVINFFGNVWTSHLGLFLFVLSNLIKLNVI